MKKYAFFNVDGALLYTLTASANALSETLESEDVSVTPEEAAVLFGGAPAADALVDIFGFSLDKASLLAERYHDYLKGRGIFDFDVIDGLVPALEKLKEKDVRLYAVSTMLDSTVKAVLEYTKLAPYFSYIKGSTADGRRSSIEDIISYMFDFCGIGTEEKKDVVLVGNKWRDRMAADVLGIDYICAAYGFIEQSEFKMVSADKIVKSPSKLVAKICKK